MNGKTLSRFIQDFKEFAKDDEVAKINKAVGQMANNFTLGMDEDGNEQLLEGIAEELMNELMELVQELIAEEEARAKDAAEEKEEP